MTWKKASESAALLRYDQVEQDWEMPLGPWVSLGITGSGGEDSEIEDGFESPPEAEAEAEESDGTEGRSCWRSTSAVVTLLCFLAIAFYPRGSAHFDLAATADLLEEWQQIPNISRVITRAQGALDSTVVTVPRLQPETPVRNLRDLFIAYQPYPEQALPFVRTACVIDAVQATAYLGHAVVWLYRAIDYNGLECPNNSFIASISWVASYLSLAASSCSNAVNSGALCAADWTAMVADMSEIASSGAGVKRPNNGEPVGADGLLIEGYGSSS
eukprot:Skav230254  [mRNA]  locus=scaffold1520:110768:115686:+ [translate_table: standard]